MPFNVVAHVTMASSQTSAPVNTRVAAFDANRRPLAHVTADKGTVPFIAEAEYAQVWKAQLAVSQGMVTIGLENLPPNARHILVYLQNADWFTGVDQVSFTLEEEGSIHKVDMSGASTQANGLVLVRFSFNPTMAEWEAFMLGQFLHVDDLRNALV